MRNRKKQAGLTIGGLVAVMALTLGVASPAFAWGGPVSYGSSIFTGNDCEAYSGKTTTTATAYTKNKTTNSWAMKVAFKYPGHTNVAPVTGTGTVTTTATGASIVSLLTCANHECGDSDYTT